MSEVYIGETLDGCPLALGRKARTEHVQIIGASGRGKTKSVILPWMAQDFCQGSDVILIDGKGDLDLANEIRRFSDDPEKVVVFDIGSSHSSATTNPLRYGSPQQIVDRIFSTFEFESAYYENVAYEAALLVVESLIERKEVVTFSGIFELLTDDGSLSELVSSNQADASPSGNTKSALEYLARSFKDRQEKLSGFLSQLRPFAVGELSGLVNGQREGRPYFSLSWTVSLGSPLVGDNSAILIFIPGLLYQKAAKRLGQMFLQEIAWASSRRHSRAFIPIFLDEFSSFVYEGFLQFLNKARSANIALHLSHQSMGDLELVSPEFAKAVVTNTSVKCVLGVNEPETAEFFARLFGTQSSTKTTERGEKKTFGDVELSGMMSVRDVEEYRIHPNRFKRFSRGQGVISFMHDGQPIIEEVQFATIPGGV